MPTQGSVTFTLNTGKTVGPFPGTLGDSSEYLDVNKGGRDYPTKLDFQKFKTVTGIAFKPGVGKAASWSSWSYFNHGEWAVDRFTTLS